MRAAPIPHTDEATIMDKAARYLLRSILLVRDVDLSAPTPCADGDLRGLLRHVDTSLREVTKVLGAHSLDEPGRRQQKTDPSADLVASIRAGTVDPLLAWRSTPTQGHWRAVWGRTLPANIVVYVAAIEMVVHAWDIAQGCRTHHPIPTDLAAALLPVSSPLAAAGAAGQLFARPVPVATTATPNPAALNSETTAGPSSRCVLNRSRSAIGHLRFTQMQVQPTSAKRSALGSRCHHPYCRGSGRCSTRLS